MKLGCEYSRRDGKKHAEFQKAPNPFTEANVSAKSQSSKRWWTECRLVGLGNTRGSLITEEQVK
jgi:hypothetical protein